MRASRLPLVIAVAFTSSSASAWGFTGHRITGELAEQHLSGATRAHIQLILGRESLSEAVTWADEMRRTAPSPFWQSTSVPWHYVTVPTGQMYSIERHAPPEGDAATALRKFRKTLRNRAATRDEKQLALRFAIHIIGDLHQPLHAGRGSDRGGNEVQVTFFGEATNLHSVWDFAMIDRQGLSFTEYAARLRNRTRPEDVIAWWQSDPHTWISESVTLRETIYPENPSLSREYAFRHLPIVERRLAQSGVRMAAWLNSVFDPDSSERAAPRN